MFTDRGTQNDLTYLQSDHVDSDIPENELQHDVLTVQRQKSPEEAQRYHTELQHKQIQEAVRLNVIISRNHKCRFP